MMNYSGIINCTIVDGTGFRTALYTSGCLHHCEKCHNCQTWDFAFGKKYTEEVEEILFDRIDKPYIKGLTLTGGDPLYHYDEIVPLLQRFRLRYGDKKDVWLYTGFSFDEIREKFSDILPLVDYIVDGEYVDALRDISLKFKGSSNQTIWEKNGDGEFVESELNK